MLLWVNERNRRVRSWKSFRAAGVARMADGGPSSLWVARVYWLLGRMAASVAISGKHTSSIGGF